MVFGVPSLIQVVPREVRQASGEVGWGQRKAGDAALGRVVVEVRTVVVVRVAVGPVGVSGGIVVDPDFQTIGEALDVLALEHDGVVAEFDEPLLRFGAGRVEGSIQLQVRILARIQVVVHRLIVRGQAPVDADPQHGILGVHEPLLLDHAVLLHGVILAEQQHVVVLRGGQLGRLMQRHAAEREKYDDENPSRGVQRRVELLAAEPLGRGAGVGLGLGGALLVVNGLRRLFAPVPGEKVEAKERTRPFSHELVLERDARREDGDVVDVIEDDHRGHEHGEDADGRDGRQRRRQKRRRRGHRREKHRPRRLPVRVRSNLGGRGARGKLRLGGRPLVVENEAVVGADADEHEQPDEVEKREKRDLQNNGGEKHRRREREEHLEHTAQREQCAPGVQPYEHQHDEDGAGGHDHIRVERLVHNLPLQVVVPGVVSGVKPGG